MNPKILSVAVRTMIAGMLLLVGMSGALSQTYPSRPVRIVVPFAPSGSSDVIARILSLKLGEAWGSGVVIENRPGAGGNIGAEAVSKAAPDGYTLLLTTPAFAVNVSLTKNAAFDPIKDFAPIMLVASTNGVLVVPPSLPVKNLQDVIAMAKARPGELFYASSGYGTSGHLFMEHFRSLTGIDVQHVPYKDNSAAQVDLVSGRVQLWITSLPAVVQFINSGKMHAIAVSGAARYSSIPAVPTMQESGVAGYEAVTWYGLFAPAGTPKDVIAKINSDIARIAQTPDVKARFAAQGIDPVLSTPEYMGSYLQSEISKWAGVVKASGLKAE